MILSDFSKAFTENSTVQSWFGELTLQQRHVGDVLLPSGFVVACDGFITYGAAPFSVQLPPGRYPVDVCIARNENNGDERIACARLRVSDAEPVRWVMATTEGQSLDDLSADEMFGYGVDSGTGCFMSAEAVQVMDEKTTEDEDYTDKLIERMEENYSPTRDWLDAELEPESGVNIVLFSSGVGDGFYASYWGYDSNDQIVCLITDFGLLHKGTEAEEL